MSSKQGDLLSTVSTGQAKMTTKNENQKASSIIRHNLLLLLLLLRVAFYKKKILHKPSSLGVSVCVFLFVWFLSVIFNLQLGSIYSFLQKLVYLFVCLSVKGGKIITS